MKRTVLIFLAIALFMFALASGIILSKRTNISVVYPAVFSIVLGFASGAVLWRKWRVVTESSAMIWNFLLNGVSAASLLFGAFYSANYAFAYSDTKSEVEGTVVRKYSETRYKSKRVARNRYTRGAPYKVYFAEVALPTGWKYEEEMSLSRWNKLRKGGSIKVELERGLFGIEVVRFNRGGKANKS